MQITRRPLIAGAATASLFPQRAPAAAGGPWQPVVSDHTPRVEGDTGWGHIGRTFTYGYICGLVQAVNAG